MPDLWDDLPVEMMGDRPDLLMRKAIDKPKKLQDVEKISTTVRPVISVVSDISYHDSKKAKAKFIEMMYRYNPTYEDIKENHYKFDVRKIDYGTPKVVLL